MPTGPVVELASQFTPLVQMAGALREDRLDDLGPSCLFVLGKGQSIQTQREPDVGVSQWCLTNLCVSAAGKRKTGKKAPECVPGNCDEEFAGINLFFAICIAHKPHHPAGAQPVRNDVPAGNHWNKIRLEGAKSNRNAVGARVLVR